MVVGQVGDLGRHGDRVLGPVEVERNGEAGKGVVVVRLLTVEAEVVAEAVPGRRQTAVINIAVKVRTQLV